MASGTFNLSSNISTLAGRINWRSTSNGSTANTSNVYAELQIHRTDSYTTTGTWRGNLIIDGTSQDFSYYSPVSSSWITVKSFTKNNIPHNSDGSKTISIGGTCNGPSGTTMSGHSASGSQSVTLDKIPRYMESYTYTVRPRINTIDIEWTTKYNCNGIKYGINANALTERSVSGTSGNLTITGLNPNTNYTVYINFRRADSNLYLTQNASMSAKTGTIANLNSVPNVTVGNSQKITWTNTNVSASYSLSLKLCKTDNTTIIDYGAVSGSEKTVTPTASTIYALSPNSNSYKARYILTTTTGGKSYTSSKDFTFNISNSNPTFSNFTYEDKDSTSLALTGNNQIFIEGYSSNSITISTANKAIAKNSATMKSYEVTQGNGSKKANYSSSTDVNINLFNIKSNIIQVSAIDSRGNSTTVSKTIPSNNYKKYTPPKILSINAERAENGISEKVILSFNGTFWNQSFGKVTNSITRVYYRYKEISKSSWADSKEIDIDVNIRGSSFDNSLEIEGDLGPDGFNLSKSYSIALTVADKLASHTYYFDPLPSGEPAIAIYGNNVAIGTKYDENIGGRLQTKDMVMIGENGSVNIHTAADHFHNTLLSFPDVDNGILALSPTPLYINDSGEDGTVILDMAGFDISDFKYIEIYYSVYRLYFGMIKFYRDSYDTGKNIPLPILYSEYDLLQMQVKNVLIKDTTITPLKTNCVDFRANTQNINIFEGGDNFYIHRVLGYRR